MRWLDVMMDRPRLVIAAVTLICALSAVAVALTRDGGELIRVDADLSALTSSDRPASALHDRYAARFGESGLLLATARHEDLLSAPGLRAVTQAHDALAALPGAGRVRSLASVPNLLRNAPDDPVLDVGSVTEQLARVPDAQPEIAASARRNPMLADVFFNAETGTAAFVVVPEGEGTGEALRALAASVSETLAAVDGLHGVAVTGNGLVDAAVADAVWDGLMVTMPVAVLLVIALLAFSFRSALVVVLGAMSIGVSLLVMWAVGGMAGISLNMVSAIAPPVVVAFGIMFSIHMVSEWLRHDVGEDVARARRAVGGVALPLLLNGLTTSIGLAALALSPLQAVKEFSLLAVTGVLSLTLLSVSYLPALLLLMGSHIGQRKLPGEALAAAAARALANFAVRWRVPVVLTAALVLLLGLLAAQRIEPGSSYIANFSQDAPVRVDYERVNHDLGGAVAIDVYLEAPLDHVLLEPEIATAVDDFVRWARTQPEVGAAVSYADHLKVLNAAMQPEAEGEPSYPASLRLARQLLSFGGRDAVRGLIDDRQRSAVVRLRIRDDHSARVTALAERMQQQLRALPPAVRAEVVGAPVRAAETVGRIVDRQWVSVAAALGAIALVLYGLFMSARAAMVAMLPNLVPVGVYFGLLGVSGIGLNPATSLVACLVIGVAVDDTIHFLARFNAEARARGSEREAVGYALGSILRPVTLTTAALCLSFTAFLLSPLASHAEFGVLAALALLLAWLTDILVTPALGSMVRIVTLWDLLRVDLGSSPQLTIPLLSGLSNRQARLFALTARYERIPAGVDVMCEGDVSADICVCVDGQMEVWVKRDGERRVLNTIFRGATLGEAGYFGQRRTANVTTTRATRLLRFDASDLERLRRRHPRIAAIVLRNLNRIQAERLARATAMLR